MKIRTVVNVAALAIVAVSAPLALKAQRSASPPGGGTCCDRAGSTCYLNLGDGIVVQQGGAYAC